LWPLNENLLQQTISVEFVLYLLGTIFLFIAVYYLLKVGYISNVVSLSPTTDNIEGSFNLSYLNPWFITGFCDAESSFVLSIYKKTTCKTGWQVQPTFAIHIHKKDEVLLKRIQSYFNGVGKWVDHSHDSVVYSVNSLNDIINVIIPHFDKYPLLTQKFADYQLFKAAVLLMKDKKHLTLDGLQEIINIRASMNRGLPQNSPLVAEFKVIPVKRCIVILPYAINPNWITGFVDGEGCFFVGLTKNSKCKVNFSVNLLFKINQHKRDTELLKKISIQLNCGTIQDNSANATMLQTKKLSDIEMKILPFFEKYPLQGVKRLEYEDFRNVSFLMKNKEHLTEEGLEKIRKIKLGMNFNRYQKKDSLKYIPKVNEVLQSSFICCSFNPTLHEVELWISISCTLLYTAIVKILKIYDNTQVTNALSSLVGTSEAIRLLNIRSIHSLNKNSPKDFRFIQWLAGLIDGDGSFPLSKKGYASLEITMDIRDERALQAVKNVYGGSIKLRSNANAMRYRLHNKEGLLNLINDVNGFIRNPVRLIQLNNICIKYGIPLIYPDKLNWNNGWLAGFFDADGSISINKTSDWQLSISAGQKTSELLSPLVDLFGGYVYIDRGSYGSFKWYVTKKEDILKLIEYFKKHPSRSAKNNRLHLIPKYYELKSMKAHKAEYGSFLAKSWDIFIEKWSNYD